ncbi:hypothetical protein MTO98_07535 [Mucilaginibacter sp. SMC90]|uniref:hypothetical protein n=1 Tax=Mucilaginibacter sp. SMC90 TaxID=2929803 RepID=UPI001FB3EC2D|nr:hypothetical protein [Mucilaginibacter sp. SMC90]UOE50928.1 hypothetical protein MTO98_07535 [Mucilaginibacter sp. SMC90]
MIKNIFYFIITACISTFAFWGSLGAKNPFPLYGVMLGIWALFFWGLNNRMKKDAARRFNERMFAEYMRSKARGPRRY